MPTDEVKIPGTPVVVGDRTFIIAPLNFRQLRTHGALLTEISKKAKNATGPERFTDLGDVLPLIHAAISRNYPDITEDQLLDIVDLSNYAAIVEAIMAVSGISNEVVRRQSAVAPGESRPPMAKSA